MRERLVEATARAIARLKRQGLTPMGMRSGTIGSSAREIGSASLPFFAHYLLDHRVLLTDPA